MRFPAVDADFKTAPHFPQLREFELSAGLPARGLLWQPRAGKTKVGIDTSCHLFKDGQVDAAIVFAPNGVHANWTRREIPKHHWDSVPYRCLTWQSSLASSLRQDRTLEEEELHAQWIAQAEGVLRSDDLCWFAFNSESMIRKDVRKLIAKILRHRRPIIHYDECHDFRTPGSTRTKMARSMTNKVRYRRIYTGTALTNSPLHAFAQFELLEKEALGYRKFGDFKEHFAEYTVETRRNGRTYPKLLRYRNLEELHDLMIRWCSIVDREECGLPPLDYETREIVLTEEQTRIYREIHGQLETIVAGRTVTIDEQTAIYIKLQQVVSGFVRDEYGVDHFIPGDNPKLDVLSEEVAMSTEKVIVWSCFRREQDLVASRLRADGHEIVEYHGRTSDGDRERALDSIMDPDGARVLVGHPGSAGQGRDMSAAGLIIWMSQTYNAIHRQQANERGTKMGGDNVRCLDIVAPPIDLFVRANCDDKVSLEEALLRGSGIKEAIARTRL